jgi:hypothetical protein
MFSVIMPGQSNPLDKPGISELRLRADAVYMNGLTVSESAAYLEKTVGRILEPGTADVISHRQESRNFLDLQRLVLTAMYTAMIEGRKTVGIGDFGDKTERKTEAEPAKPKTGILRSIMQKRAEDEPTMAMAVNG